MAGEGDFEIPLDIRKDVLSDLAHYWRALPGSPITVCASRNPVMPAVNPGSCHLEGWL